MVAVFFSIQVAHASIVRGIIIEMDNMEGQITVGPAGLAANVPIQIFPEAGGYAASCAPLGVTSQGDTREEAEENLKGALGLFFEELIRAGSLDDVLMECGWAKLAAGPETLERFAPPRVESRAVEVTVPPAA